MGEAIFNASGVFRDGSGAQYRIVSPATFTVERVGDPTDRTEINARTLNALGVDVWIESEQDEARERALDPANRTAAASDG